MPDLDAKLASDDVIDELKESAQLVVESWRVPGWSLGLCR